MINGIKDLGIDSRYPGDLGLMPDGIPTNEQAKEFIEYVNEIKTIINNELKS
jgi:hypothetical protein